MESNSRFSINRHKKYTKAWISSNVCKAKSSKIDEWAD